MDKPQLTESLPFQAELPPLRLDQGGAVRVANGRITLDLIVEQYENGMTPEEMVRAYDTLALADVHAVIAYLLRHRDEVQAYLKQRTEEAAALQAKIAAHHAGGATGTPHSQGKEPCSHWPVTLMSSDR